MTKPLSPPLSPPVAGNADPRGGGDAAAATGGGLDTRLSPASETFDLTLFPFSEPLLATSLGLPLRNLTNARVKKLARGRDWELDGGTALLTEPALTELIKAAGLNLTPAELRLVCEKSRREQLPPEFTAKVCRFPLNRRLLTVRWMEGTIDRRADVLVTKRENFRLGMEVPIRLNPTSQRYELAARPPRRKGRW